MVDNKEKVSEAEQTAEALKDIATTLSRVFSKMEDKSGKVVDRIESSVSKSLSWNNLLKDALLNMDGLSGKIKDVNGLQEAMTKNSKLHKKVMQHISDVTNKEFAEGMQEIKDTFADINASPEQLEEALRRMEHLQKKINKEHDLEEVLLKRKKGLYKKQTESLTNMVVLVNKMRDAAFNPGKAIEGLISKLGSLHPALNVVAGVFQGFFLLIKSYYEFLDKQVMPAQAEFNKVIGATSIGAKQAKQQMISTGMQFERLGYSFEEGAAKVRDLMVGMKQVKFDKSTLQTGLELQSILGLTGKESGMLALQFTKQTGSLDGLNDMMDQGARSAKSYGLPVNEVLTDMGRSPDILARFGQANAKAFAKAAAKAHSYGLTIKDVNSAFGEVMDSFESTSSVAAKLNTIFGTNINSMKLLMTQDETKRMEMVRRELLKVGKSWDQLDRFEQNVVATNFKMSKSQLALMLSSDKERKKLEKKRKEREKSLKVNEKWNKGLQSIKKTLFALGPVLRQLGRAFTRFIARLLFGLDMDKSIKSTTDLLSTLFSDITKGFDKAAKTLGKEGFSGLITDLPKLLEGSGDKIRSISESIGKIADNTEKFMNIIEKVKKFLGGGHLIDAEKSFDAKLLGANIKKRLKSMLDKKKLESQDIAYLETVMQNKDQRAILQEELFKDPEKLAHIREQMLALNSQSLSKEDIKQFLKTPGKEAGEKAFVNNVILNLPDGTTKQLSSGVVLSSKNQPNTETYTVTKIIG